MIQVVLLLQREDVKVSEFVRNISLKRIFDRILENLEEEGIKN